MRNVLFYGNILLYFVLAVALIFAPNGMGPLQVRWRWWIALVLILSFGGVVVAIGRLESQVKNRIKARLRERIPLDSDAFAETFYATDGAAGVIAGQVRDILAANLHLNLNGLHPADRLNDELDADLAANPDLFSALARAFAVSIPTAPARLAQYAEAIVSFDDLVQYLVVLRESRDSPSM